MRTIHKTTIVAQCPVNGGPDVYKAQFAVGSKLVKVETISEVIDRFTAEPILQEELTKRLAEELKCWVTTTGTHGRFTTECIAP